MTAPHPHPTPFREAGAAITRIWQPADGSDLLAEILREVIAANGTLTARIPAVALTPDDLAAAGARAANTERVA